MRTDFRNRAFLPVVMPLGILLGVAALVALFATILLYNTREAAIVIALVGAAGILTAVALAASQDELHGKQKAAVLAAGILPLAAGGIFSIASAQGAIPADQLQINAQPHIQVPEGAVIAAADAQDFCLPPEEGTCEPVERWELPTQEPPLRFEFVNLDGGTPHNVQIFELAGSEDEPEAGEGVLTDTEIITGVASTIYTVEEGLATGTYYFNCQVHPNMNGVLEVVEGGEGEGDSEA